MTYQDWNRKGQYNSDKAEAAWKFAEKQENKKLLAEIDIMIKREEERYKEAKESAGINCCGACMASGAIEVLIEIKELGVT